MAGAVRGGGVFSLSVQEASVMVAMQHNTGQEIPAEIKTNE